MKKLISALLANIILAPSAFAAAFDGPFVQIGLGGANSTTQASYSQSNMRNLGYGDFNVSGGSFLGQVLAGYSKSVDLFNIAGNVFYNIGNQQSGAYSHTSGAGTSVSESISQNFKLKNTWGVSIEPGYYLGRSTLGYLKLSYFNSRLSYAADYQMNVNGSVDNTSAQSSQRSANGMGFGLGFKQSFAENWYGFAEYQYVQYNTWNDTLFQSAISYKPNQNYGLVGVGYKF